jgi:hypothetical protein
MEISLDTVCLSKLLRTRATTRQPRLSTGTSCTVFDDAINRRRLRLAVDVNGALINEWEETCGRELIRVLVAKWEPIDALKVIRRLPSIPYRCRTKLRRLGFVDPIDKLLLKLAIATRERILVSDDSDFWDPADSAQRGDPRAQIAHICQTELRVSIWLLVTLIRTLERRSR